MIHGVLRWRLQSFSPGFIGWVIHGAISSHLRSYKEGFPRWGIEGDIRVLIVPLINAWRCRYIRRHILATLLFFPIHNDRRIPWSFIFAFQSLIGLTAKISSSIYQYHKWLWGNDGSDGGGAWRLTELSSCSGTNISMDLSFLMLYLYRTSQIRHTSDLSAAEFQNPKPITLPNTT